MNKKKVVAVVLFVCLVLSVSVQAGSVLVVTNKGVPGSAVSPETIKKIFSGQMTKWPDNQTIVVAVMENSAAHKDFLKTYVNKSESQFSSTWKKMMFTGQASYPKNFDSAQNLVNFVSKTPGAIGYVETGAGTDGVNVIK